MFIFKFFEQATSATERSTEQFYLWPNANIDIYDDMNMIGVAIDNFNIHFCFEQGSQSGKQFMVYQMPSDCERVPSSRQYVPDAENFSKTVANFHVHQQNAIENNLYLLNQNEYKEFYTKFEAFWWDIKHKSKPLSTTLLETFGLIQEQPVQTRQQEYLELMESIQHLQLNYTQVPSIK